jgi:hypothetical protein
MSRRRKPKPKPKHEPNAIITIGRSTACVSLESITYGRVAIDGQVIPVEVTTFDQSGKSSTKRIAEDRN